MRTGFVCFGLVLGLSIAVGLIASPPQLISRPVPDRDLVERGRREFIIACAGCHGDDARGDSGPDLIRSEMMLSDEGGDLLGPFLDSGGPDHDLEYGDAEVAGLAGFVRAQSQAVINRGLYQIQNVVTGDADRGRAYFNGEGGCSGCHSVTGDLAGIGGRMSAPNLLARIAWPGRGGRGGLPTEVEVTLGSGQTLVGTLAYIDDFSVALRNESGYRSFSRDGVDVEIRNPYEAHIELLGRYTDDDLHDVLTYLVTPP
jgi:mono/diheme cytochrome c family protein